MTQTNSCEKRLVGDGAFSTVSRKLEIMASDLAAVRQYVVAKDGLEYEDLPEGIVCLHISHSNLKMQMVDIRLDLHMTIAQVKEKIYRHCGTQPGSMRLLLQSANGVTIGELQEDFRMLGFYSVTSGMRLHVVDTDPFSLSKGGGLEDVTLVQKYEISEEDYDKREKTVRAYKREQLAKDPNWKPKTMMRVKQPSHGVNDPATTFGPESIQHMHVGDRCEVQPGGRRGEICFLGQVPEISPGVGMWVGIRFDEPVGKGNGTVKGTIYFECANKYGGFIRPNNVTVGDFPPQDDDLLLDDSDQEL